MTILVSHLGYCISWMWFAANNFRVSSYTISRFSGDIFLFLQLVAYKVRVNVYHVGRAPREQVTNFLQHLDQFTLGLWVKIIINLGLLSSLDVNLFYAATGCGL